MDWDHFLKKHLAFWDRAEVDRPLMREVHPYRVSRRGVEPMKLPLPDGTFAPDGCVLTPDMLDPATLHAGYREDSDPGAFGRTLGGRRDPDRAEPATNGDVFAPVAPYAVVPWVEAILGCPIIVSLPSHSLWSQPYWEDRWPEEDLEPEIDPRWLNKLREFVAFLVDHAHGRYLVAHTLMRGVSDLIEALIGGEKLCLSVHDCPDRLHRLADRCADLFLDIALAQLELIPPFHGGTCNLFGLWSPGTSVRTQDDASVLLSPPQYAEFILPYQERIAAAFDRTMIHLHSRSLHVADLLCQSGISGIQISIDPQPYGPTVPELLPICQRILEHKPLLLEGPFTQAELDLTLETLPPRGLCLGASLEADEDRAGI